MNSFQTTTALLKAILSQSKQGKIYDKDVAVALGIKPSTFATMKKRNMVPYTQIINYCVINKINANDLFFSEPVTLEELRELAYRGDA